MHFTIYADGGARGNPGPAGAGAVIYSEGGELLASVSKFLGQRTNNFAEYEAIILALEKLAQLLPEEKRAQTQVLVKMDSELVVKQMRGEYKVKHPALKEQQARLKERAAVFGGVAFTHVPRAQNKEADLLANRAMDNGYASEHSHG